MKIAFCDHEANLASYLTRFRPVRLSCEEPSRFRARLLRLQIPCPVPFDLRRLNFDFLFHYDVFPKSILKFFGEWQLENRELQIGDVIVQQAHLPPAPLGLKLIFGVRVVSAYRNEHKAGFSYGTLIGHPEKGTNEFFFSVEDGTLSVVVRTMAGLGLFVTRLLWPFVTRPYADFCNRQALLHMREQFLKCNSSPPSKEAGMSSDGFGNQATRHHFSLESCTVKTDGGMK